MVAGAGLTYPIARLLDHIDARILGRHQALTLDFCSRFVANSTAGGVQLRPHKKCAY